MRQLEIHRSLWWTYRQTRPLELSESLALALSQCEYRPEHPEYLQPLKVVCFLPPITNGLRGGPNHVMELRYTKLAFAKSKGRSLALYMFCRQPAASFWKLAPGNQAGTYFTEEVRVNPDIHSSISI